MTDLHELSAVQLRLALAVGELTATQCTQYFADRIVDCNDQLRAFSVLTIEDGLRRAAELDQARANGDRSASDLERAPLWGVPFGDKDLSDRAGVVSTWGSRLGGAVANVDSPIVAAMDAVGGVSLGKTNCPEFGLTAFGDSKIGPARNPWALDRAPGGSSSGAAVAVAARLLPWAPGSDGGGSIRIPAACCGVLGLKTSRGRIPANSGLESLAGLELSGPIARSVEDLALLLDGMLGPTPRDARHQPLATAAPPAPTSYWRALREAESPRQLKIGLSTWTPWPKSWGIEIADEALTALEQTADLLRQAGHQVLAAPQIPDSDGYADAFSIVWQAGTTTIPLTDEQLQLAEPLTRGLMHAGRRLSAEQLVNALSWLNQFEARVIESYRPFDFILTPALAGPAPLVEVIDDEPWEENFIRQTRFTPFTSYLNASGLPALAMPVGDAALPVGVQAIGRVGDELGLLALARELERELHWEQRRPPIS